MIERPSPLQCNFNPLDMWLSPSFRLKLVCVSIRTQAESYASRIKKNITINGAY